MTPCTCVILIIVTLAKPNEPSLKLSKSITNKETKIGGMSIDWRGRVLGDTNLLEVILGYLDPMAVKSASLCCRLAVSIPTAALQ